jgi:type IV pilus assembly protein PilA
MKEMILARKAELEKRGVKGFTLMEMLIVVAIIAVLVAIAIPVFSSQLNNARTQADAANIRSGYAVVAATVLTDNVTADTTYYLNSDGTVSTTTPGTFTAQSTGTENISGQSPKWTKGKGISYVYTAATSGSGSGTIEIIPLS